MTVKIDVMKQLCYNDDCDFYWICNNIMSEKAVKSDGWCKKVEKYLEDQNDTQDLHIT